MTRIAVACASHDAAILDANLARSPLFGAGVPLHVEQGAPSAAVAYNRAIAATTAPVIVFTHHDVFLPLGWDRLLAARIAEVAATDPDWALIGAFGVGLNGAHWGPVWSSSLGQIVGRVPLVPVQVQSFDEMLVVWNRRTAPRWDEALPGWHMYGTDIVQAARARGHRAWATGLPCIHNDRYHGALGPDFDAAYRAMQRKWRGSLPIRTPIVKISASGLHLIRDRWQNRRSASFRAGMATGTDHTPEWLAARCGWGDLTGSV
jgi:hypothetical protein